MIFLLCLSDILTWFLAAFIGVRFINISNLSLFFHFLLGPSGGFKLQVSVINFQKFCKNYSGFSLVYNFLSQNLGLKKWGVLFVQNYQILGQRGCFGLQLPFNSGLFSKAYFCWHLGVITWFCTNFQPLILIVIWLWFSKVSSPLGAFYYHYTWKISNNIFLIFPIFFFAQEQSF
jgi:hypothetical protein